MVQAHLRQVLSISLVVLNDLINILLFQFYKNVLFPFSPQMINYFCLSSGQFIFIGSGTNKNQNWLLGFAPVYFHQ